MNPNYHLSMTYDKLLFKLILVLLPLSIYGQGLKVKKMELLPFDVSASTHLRNDSTGVPCGLVKVQVNNPSLKFGKESIGPIDNKVNEYWVYLSKGTKSLTIKQQFCLPMSIHFKDYGIEEIESKTCYLLLLKDAPINSDKNTLVVNVKPSTAKVVIDNHSIDTEDNGSYRFYLEKGEHVCKITADGYRPAIEITKTGKGIQTLDVELESLMAEVNFSCEMSDAELYVNNQKRGIGNWNGFLPAGKVIIEAHKEGFEPVMQTVMLEEKGKHEFRLPSLKRLIGKVWIESVVSDFNSVMLDGEEKNINGFLLSEVSSGKHTLTILKYGYDKVTIPFIASGKGTDTIQIQLKPTIEYESILKGNNNLIVGLGKKCILSKDYNQANFWLIQSIDKIDNDDILMEIANIFGNSDIVQIYNREEAIKACLKIIENNKNSQEYIPIDRTLSAYSRIGGLYKKEKKYSEAIPWYKECAKYDHGDSGHYWYCLDLGDCYVNINNIEQARYWYKRASTSRFDNLRNKALAKLESLK